MLSILDIILISLGGALVVFYAILKILQLHKFRKLTQEGINAGLTEQQARKQAYEVIYNKTPKKDTLKLDDNEETFD